VLIEVAIAICVMGVLVSITVPTLRSIVAYSKATQTRQALARVIHTLAVYVKSYDRLPWATSDANGIEHEQQIIGGVPFKTLGIEEQVTKDGEKNALIYVVNPMVAPWRERTPFTPAKPSIFMQIPVNDNMRVVLEDGTDAINQTEEPADFHALVLISISPKSNYTADEIVQIDGARITVHIPPTNSGVAVRWLSKNNIGLFFD
jgi:type II secretory pathway pseudopilin PulG